MPAFKYRQKNSLIVFERGHKAHGYVQTADVFLLSNRPLRPGLHTSTKILVRSPVKNLALRDNGSRNFVG